VVRRACGWMQGIWSPKLKQVSTEKWKKKIHGAPGSLPRCPPSLSPLDFAVPAVVVACFPLPSLWL